MGWLEKLLHRTPATEARHAARARIAAAIGELRDGEPVTLTGIVVAGDALLEAPLSGSACVFWLAIARLREAGGIDELTSTKLAAFRLQVTDALVDVEGERAETELAPRAVIPRHLERDRQFLANHGRDRGLARAAGFDEIAVLPGDRISVHGVIAIERVAAAGEAGYRDEAIRVRLFDHPAHRLALGKPR